MVSYPLLSYATYQRPLRIASQGVLADVIAWNAVLDTLGRARQLPLMLDKYDEMCTSGVRPNVVTISSMIAHTGNGGDWRMAEQLWENMLSRNLEPGMIAYNTRLHNYAAAGHMDKAEAVLAEMSETSNAKPDAVSYERYVFMALSWS